MFQKSKMKNRYLKEKETEIAILKKGNCFCRRRDVNYYFIKRVVFLYTELRR